MIMQQEHVRTITRGKEDGGTPTSFAVQANAAGKNVRHDIEAKEGVCKHCGRPGHDKEGCFQVIGYPEWWGDRPRSQGRGGGRGRGSHSGAGSGGYARANAARVIGSPTDKDDGVTESDKEGITGFCSHESVKGAGPQW